VFDTSWSFFHEGGLCAVDGIVPDFENQAEYAVNNFQPDCYRCMLGLTFRETFLAEKHWS
jgi:hypothetical protein